MTSEYLRDLIPRCDNCTFSDDGPSPADPTEGRWLLCRRHSPRVFSSVDDGYIGGDGVFPRVARNDWCGEWVISQINTGEKEQITYLQLADIDQ
jgi:hypothetical protein